MEQQLGAAHDVGQARAMAEAERIVNEARAEAQRITAQAREEVRQMEQRRQVGPAEAHAVPSSRAFVAIFFHDELAAATGSFSDGQRVGGGGFGSVYVAQLPGLGDEDAVHAVKKLDTTSMQGHTEFLQEVQVLGACRHENLLPLLGFSADRGTGQLGQGLCLVTPLMKGGSLEDRLFLTAAAQRRLASLPGAPPNGFAPLGWQQLLSAAVAALRGLEYLHTPDRATHKPAILHSDIKPSNILLDLDGGARLADMGLARALRADTDNLTTVTTVAGTHGFMEQGYEMHGRFDKLADGYAMGVTLLVLITRWPPFDADHGTIFGRCFNKRAEIVSMARQHAAQWPRDVAQEIYDVGMSLVHPARLERISVAQAKQRLEALEEARLARPPAADDTAERQCIVCWSAPRHVRFACGHSQLCQGCLSRFLQRPAPRCNICRAPVSRDRLIMGDHVAQQDTFVRQR